MGDAAMKGEAARPFLSEGRGPAKGIGISGFAKRPLSRRGLFKLTRLTLGGILFCILVSSAFNTHLFWTSDAVDFRRSLIAATVLPLVLAGPLFIFLSLKLRELSQLNRELHYAASHDGLTTLLNRSAFTEAVNLKIADIATAQGHGRGALLLIDADFFKSINDRWGHAMGDEVLKEIAAHLLAVAGGRDVVGRLGGEEFGIFLTGSGLRSAADLAERLRFSIDAMRIGGPRSEAVPVTISIGGVVFQESTSFDEIFQRADRMLYRAKGNGRNRVEMAELRTTRMLESAA